MPLTNWTERDQLLSDALHNLDVGLGLDVPLTVDLDGQFDETSGVPEELWSSSFHRWGAHEDAAADDRTPVLSSDDRDIDEAFESAMPTSRWRDGAAAGAAIEQLDAHVTSFTVGEHENAIDALYEQLHEASEWEHDLLVEEIGEHFDAIASLTVEGGEEAPSPFSEEPILPANLRRYVKALLTGRNGARALTITATGHEPFPTAAASARFDDERVAYMSRLARARARVTRGFVRDLHSRGPLPGLGGTGSRLPLARVDMEGDYLPPETTLHKPCRYSLTRGAWVRGMVKPSDGWVVEFDVAARVEITTTRESRFAEVAQLQGAWVDGRWVHRKVAPKREWAGYDTVESARTYTRRRVTRDINAKTVEWRDGVLTVVGKPLQKASDDMRFRTVQTPVVAAEFGGVQVVSISC